MADYLNWHSDLSLQTVFSGSAPVSYPEIWGDEVLYLSSHKGDQGRAILKLLINDETICLTPDQYSLGTKFSEYGGKPYWIEKDKLIFANLSDQCLYRQLLSDNGIDEPVRVSPKLSKYLLMYAEVMFISKNYLMCIIEQESLESLNDRENISYLGIVDTDEPDNEPIILIQGADFYSNLCVDIEHKKIAWVQWNHPNMPWDETELWIADFVIDTDKIKIINHQKIHLDNSASVCQLLFASNGKLFFSADFKNQNSDSPLNYWNISVIDPKLPVIEVIEVTKNKLEFGYPHWQYGDARIVQFDEKTILTFASTDKSDVLFMIDQDSLAIEKISEDQFSYQNLSSNGNGRAVVILLSTDVRPAVAMLKTKNASCFKYLVAPSYEIANEEISYAEHIKFPTLDGKHAYGFYYPPVNSAYINDLTKEEFPPLIVMIHGGPTARAYGNFDIQKQFWTQRGFAIFDVNHRGSSGYGRKYRDALYSEWGVLDTSDIIDGINYLIKAGKVDEKRVCIRGKSAGGYAVLRALTEYPEVFCAGACYYGIGNLVTLAETTHKFEKYYADRMIGETYNKFLASGLDSRFQKRSPINKIAQLHCAMIIFQGLRDKVVPPKVAHEIIDVLKSLGLDHSYVEYADEGHGFKQASNNIDALSKEFNFFRKSLRNL